MLRNNLRPDNITTGVVGLGLMGSSIVVSLLIAGHPVIALAPQPEDLHHAPGRIRTHLEHCLASALVPGAPDDYLQRLIITDDYQQLSPCQLVMECVIELQEIKSMVYSRIESVVTEDTVIATNTSAIPISDLQLLVRHPQRFMGIHWAEPSYLTRFMEITCGNMTSPALADRVFQLAHLWGKEPTLLRKDIRGFVTNRLMYAVYREAFHLLEDGHAEMQDIDKSFKYDAGSWMTLMGIFRRMDFTGLQDYEAICKTIFPLLDNSTTVPRLMQEMIDNKSRGTQNLSGLYSYSSEQAAKIEQAFASFNQEIFKLAAGYPATGVTNRTVDNGLLEMDVETNLK